MFKGTWLNMSWERKETETKVKKPKSKTFRAKMKWAKCELNGRQENRQDTAETSDGATINAVIYFKEDKLSTPIVDHLL